MQSSVSAIPAATNDDRTVIAATPNPLTTADEASELLPSPSASVRENPFRVASHPLPQPATAETTSTLTPSSVTLAPNDISTASHLQESVAQDIASGMDRKPAAEDSDKLREAVEEGVETREPEQAGAGAAVQDASSPSNADDVEELPTPQGEPSLTFDDVLVSATESFPAIREASLLRSLAIGNQIAAMGEFDDKLEAYSINQPLSYYENYRHGVGWKKPLMMGGTAYLGYRLGAGDFEPWYKERETNEGGELKAGFDIPLLQNRAIDPRRTAVRLASLDIQSANPELFQQVLMTQYEAASAYWTWFAAAKQYAISLELMELAEERVNRIKKQIEAGDVARIVGIDNRRLLATRRAKLIESQQKLDSAAIKLSLYYRDPLGRPVRPSADSQPDDFPSLPTKPIDVAAEVTRAFTNRPELQILGITEEQIRAELRLAINQRLPELSFGSEISQDVGGLASSSGDKQPLILEAGLIGTVPVQRRKAIGKAQALRAKLAQVDAKRQLTGDKITNEVQLAATIYDAALRRVEQARLTKDLARQTLDAGEVSFTAGDIDILLLNIYEQAFADAGVEVINAQADLLTAEAMLIIATGRSLLIDDTTIPLILNNIP